MYNKEEAPDRNFKIQGKEKESAEKKRKTARHWHKKGQENLEIESKEGMDKQDKIAKVLAVQFEIEGSDFERDLQDNIQKIQGRLLQKQKPHHALFE